MGKETCFKCSEYLDICECGETETYDTGFIICPHCGNKHDPGSDPCSEYYEDGELEHDCSSCSKSFEVEVYVSYSYTCHRSQSN